MVVVDDASVVKMIGSDVDVEPYLNSRNTIGHGTATQILKAQCGKNGSECEMSKQWWLRKVVEVWVCLCGSGVVAAIWGDSVSSGLDGRPVFAVVRSSDIRPLAATSPSTAPFSIHISPNFVTVPTYTSAYHHYFHIALPYTTYTTIAYHSQLRQFWSNFSLRI